DLAGAPLRGRDRDGRAVPAAAREPRQGVLPAGGVGRVPLHETDHAREAARLTARPEARGDRARRRCRAGAAGDRPDAGDWLSRRTATPSAGPWRKTAPRTTSPRACSAPQPDR